MSGELIGVSSIGVLMVLLVLRVPIGVALISVSMGGIWLLLGPRPATGLLVSTPHEFVGKWTLSAIPMFLLMGFVCYHSGLTRGLFQLARRLLWRLPGGLAVASIFGSAGFAAVSGSSLATAAAMGRISVPEMLKSNYSPALATGTLAAAGTLGALIPPSIILILYGVFAEVPIRQLFLGGIAVGLLTALVYSVTVIVQVLLFPSVAPKSVRQPGESMRDVWFDTIPTVILVVFVLGGMFGGFFTATEAGAIGAAASIGIAYIKGLLSFSLLSKSIIETLVATSSLFLISIGAILFTKLLALSGATEAIGEVVGWVFENRILFFLTVALVYVILGMFLEPIGAMLLTLPVFLPFLSGVDVDPIWFGIFVAKLLEVGMITPPIGLNVFVISRVVGNSIALTTIFRGIIPFLVADVIILTLMVMFPDIITYLPSLVAR